MKYLVHILNNGGFSHETRCTLMDLVPDNLTRTLFAELENKEELQESEVISESSED